jgi:hypothetical protein
VGGVGGGGNRVGNGSGNRVNNGNVNIGNSVNVGNGNYGGGGYYGGGYYGGWGAGAVAAGFFVGAATAAVVGSMYASLPPSCGAYMTSYYYCGGVYYQPRYEGDNVTYVIVDKPG